MFLSEILAIAVCVMAATGRAATIKSKPIKAEPKSSLRAQNSNGGGDVFVSTLSQQQPITKIVGGSNTDYGEYKYYVQLLNYDGPVWHLCGGTLIAPNVVLTAAHCYGGDEFPMENVTVGAYEFDWNTGAEDGYAQHAKITDLVIHPSYDQGENIYNYDLMLLKLDESFHQIETIKLNSDDNKPNPGEFLIVIGLGELDMYADPEDEYVMSPDVLQEVVVETREIGDCEWIIDETEICTAYINEKDGGGGGYGFCFGDSGGPVVEVDPTTGEHIQMGVVSTLQSPCGGNFKDQVSSRISTSYEWIQQTVCVEWGIDASFCDTETDTLEPSTSSPTTIPPTTSEEYTPSPSTGGSGSCSSEETYMFFEIKVDAFGAEVLWDLRYQNGEIVFSDEGFADGETRTYEFCLSKSASSCYHLNIYDSYGDGMEDPYEGESAYVTVLFGTASYSGNPDFGTHFPMLLCH